ncbi:DnaJ domain-containing protein [Winogradskyella maritima]|uniref:J domain-containing protein n=1 Tax=Winogradskyella maritima TaxID=1517766 RepID=A0ABV8AL10_9FLAO|nr:DnaJ domain-containing protein [Winogradskyella maritima]
MKILNYYNILGVSENSDLETIKKTFRREIALYHPENNSHPDAKQKFDALVEAFNVLSHPEKRKEYDILLKKSQTPTEVAVITEKEEQQYEDWQKEAKKKSDTSWETPLTELLLLDLFFDFGFIGLFDNIGDTLGDALGDIGDIFDIF